MAIYFHNEDISFHLNRQNNIKKWIKEVIGKEKYILGSINIIFTSRKRIFEINLEYLGHDYFTDIITFEYNENNVISGDIFICPEVVHENAGEYKTTLENELLRVIIHGILHLIGYDDQDEKDKANMRKMEDIYLALIPS
ncbi:MAG: rRNA maturation RNase YbeY [bacterium]